LFQFRVFGFCDIILPKGSAYSAYAPVSCSFRFDVDQELPGGWFRPRQVNVCGDARWTELKYSGCFHLSSSKAHLTLDISTVDGATATDSLA
jgi:hypothetical protein